MKRKSFTFLVILIMICSTAFIMFSPVKQVKADELSDTIEDQIDNIDLSELEEFFENLNDKPDGVDFFGYVYGMLKGEYNLDYSSLLNYTLNVFLSKVYAVLPIFINIIAIAIFCGIINNSKGAFLKDEIADVIFFVCFSSIILLLSGQIYSIFENIKNTIESISKLTEIMSPIIFTLMIGSGGSVSAAIYKPAVTFLTGIIIYIMTYVIIPLIGIMAVFSAISNFSSSLKLKKFSDFAAGIIKWIIGLIITVFGIFITVQGISGAPVDGISWKAAKYAISNSIPLVGGFLKDGFDLVIAGSVLIKNAVGVSVIFVLFYVILSPVLYMAAFSLLLKLTAAVTEPVADLRISDFCTSMSKSISYLLAVLLTVGFMLFIIVLLIIFSANAFI